MKHFCKFFLIVFMSRNTSIVDRRFVSVTLLINNLNCAIKSRRCRLKCEEHILIQTFERKLAICVVILHVY